MRSLAAKLQRLGEVLASASGLMGWFGIDYVLRDGEPWPVEVNPRYTASVESSRAGFGRALCGLSIALRARAGSACASTHPIAARPRVSRS